MKKKLSNRITTGILALTAMFAMFSGTATAAEKFDDKATVKIEGLSSKGNNVYTLEKTGEDKGGSGIYRIHTSQNVYLTAMKADAGTQVGWTNQGSGEKGAEWILFKNSTGWSLMAKANAANTVSRNSKSSSGLDLQRNEGSKNQVWNITPNKAGGAPQPVPQQKK